MTVSEAAALYSPPLTKPSSPPVIVLGGGITALGVVRILSRQGLRPLVLPRPEPVLARSRWFRPLQEDLHVGGHDRLADVLATLKLDHGVLLPCTDHWVSEVASLSPRLRERFPASVSAAETLRQFVDKGRFAATLRQTGTPHPWSEPVASRADLARIPDAMFSSAILKPRDSQRFIARFGVKAFHVSSRDDAAGQLDRLVAEGFPVILQEYIPGPATQHYFVDGFVDRLGEVRALFVRQRLRMYPADFGNSTYMISSAADAAPGATAAIAALLRHTGYRGIFSAEFKLDPRDNVFKILEVNARAWWYVDFAARCGVDVCRMSYNDALERPVDTVTTYKVGKRLVFPYSDYFACAELRSHGQLSVWQWLRSWVGAMQPVFRMNDPGPSLRGALEVLGGFVTKRVRRLVSSR